MKNAIFKLISKLDTTKEEISEFEDMSIEISQTEKQRDNEWGKRKKISRHQTTDPGNSENTKQYECQ